MGGRTAGGIRARDARTLASRVHRLGVRRRAARPRRRGGTRSRVAGQPAAAAGGSADRLFSADPPRGAGGGGPVPPVGGRDRLAEARREVCGRQHNVLHEASRAARAPTPPDRFGSVRVRGYRCLQRIAVGGSSSVYLAELPKTGEQRVLKIFRQVPDIVEGGDTFDRFLREYHLVAHLDHPNIARIYDIGVADDHVFLAMEYFPGGDLRQRMGQSLPWREARGFLRQMAGALGALHAVGVLHRDVKPGNVMLREDGSAAFIDFGLARQLGLESDLTATGVIFGTPHYMSPEQGHGKPLDERSDLYSLGIVLHELLTGEKPYVAETAMGVSYCHATAPIPSLPRRLGHVQPLLDALLAKDPAERPSAASEIVALIDELLAGVAAWRGSTRRSAPD